MKYLSFYWKNKLRTTLGMESSQLDKADIHPTCVFSVSSYIDAKDGRVIIGERSTIHPYAMLIANGGDILVGSGLSLNPFSILYSGKAGLKIGDNVRIAAHVVVIPENHNYDKLDVPIRFQGVNSKGVVIGSDVWIGAGVKILDGTVIGDGCVIGANSVVRGNIPPHTVAVGVPAKPIKQR